MALLTQLVEHKLRHVLDWRSEDIQDSADAISHPEKDNCGSCVADESPAVSYTNLDALISVSIGSNHHPNPEFFSISTS